MCWNVQVEFKFNRIYEEWKRVTPETISIAYSEFNRIYEEWKQFTLVKFNSQYLQFNRIYEEWKQVYPWLSLWRAGEFNRIYEEWKQRIAHRGQEPPKGSIESMRNGNDRTGVFTDHERSSSIESMRNGNKGSQCSSLKLTSVQSNLWGMETGTNNERRKRTERVQSNLWGMETARGFFRARQAGSFNRIYEEWKR